MRAFIAEEAAAAGQQARESGAWLNCHAQNPESIKLAVRSGFRSVYHCSYADDEAVDLLTEARDAVFLSPDVGIMWANVYESEEFGIDRAQAERMGSVRALEAMTVLEDPDHRRRRATPSAPPRLGDLLGQQHADRAPRPGRTPAVRALSLCSATASCRRPGNAPGRRRARKTAPPE